MKSCKPISDHHSLTVASQCLPCSKAIKNVYTSAAYFDPILVLHNYFWKENSLGVESTRHALLLFLIWQGYTVYSECMCAIYVDCPEYLNCPGNSWMPFTFQPALQKERALMLTD